MTEVHLNNQIGTLCLLLSSALGTACSTQSFFVVKDQNAAKFHTSELCLYLHSPEEVPGWNSVPEENAIIKLELERRGFNTESSCTAFEYGQKECEKKSNLSSDLLQVCVKQYAEDFNSKRKLVIDRYARNQADLKEKQKSALEGIRKNIEDMQKLQDRWTPYKKPF